MQKNIVALRVPRLTLWCAALGVCLFVLIVVGCNSTIEQPTLSAAKAVDNVDIGTLKQAVVPFRTAEAGGDYSDLASLKQIVGNARIVSLGEGTHGTREFFQMKHRILEYLVKEMGFTMFAIEATWAEANRVNDYVMNGNGDPAVLLSNLYFWTWNTQEVLAMIQWMRQYNQTTTGRKIGFYGFDMQFSRVTMNDVEAYVQRVDPIAAAKINTLYLPYRAFQDTIRVSTRSYTTASLDERQQCRTNVRAVYDLLLASESKYVNASSQADYDQALRAARIVVQNEEMFSAGNNGSASRDRSMAENAAWLLKQGGQNAKIVLWAHNAHVSNSIRFDMEWMGSYLRKQFGSDMVIMGFSFGSGNFNAVESNGTSYLGLKPLSTSLVPDNSYEYQFRRLQLPRFFVDVRSFAQTSSGQWMKETRAFRSIGAVYALNYQPNYFYSTNLPNEFDVIIYFDTTQASVLLPFRYSLVAQSPVSPRGSDIFSTVAPLSTYLFQP
jgi:erythromycin esterase